MSLVGIRRTKTVCDVRPEEVERDGRPKKRNIFSKMLRSFSRTIKKRNKSSSKSTAGSTINIETSSKATESLHGDLPGTSFGDSHAHNHGSDSASTGYVSEGSSRRTANIQQCLLDLEHENKLAKRAHSRVQPVTRETHSALFLARSQSLSVQHQRRASDTDLERDETDLDTDDDRDSEVPSDESDERESDSFYTSDCSSSSYMSEDESRGVASKRHSNQLARHAWENQASGHSGTTSRRQHHRSGSSKLLKAQHIGRTLSAREFGAFERSRSATAFSRRFERDFNKTSSSKEKNSKSSSGTKTSSTKAPTTSPALRARIMRLELGDQIDPDSGRKIATNKSASRRECEKSRRSDKDTEQKDISPVGSPGGRTNAVKEIASRFLEAQPDTQPVKLHDLKRAKSTSNTRTRSVLEKFAPKLESESVKKDDEPKLVGIRRSQSTKILDLAANLFQPGSEISTTSSKGSAPCNSGDWSPESGGGGDHVEAGARSTPTRKLPLRSQTVKMTSPTALQRGQSSDSFIRELLEMAKVEVTLVEEKPKKSANDFKSQICQASTKIARRKTLKEDDFDKPISCLRATKSTTTPHSHAVGGPSMSTKVEELDPFVEEILSSETVPIAVKNKIKEECWSLFNDPRTPKGVKQCILNTMLTKTQSE